MVCRRCWKQEVRGQYMILEKIYIQSFGKLKNQEIPLSSGINILHGPNESGKTTVQVFIKSMLFGLSRMRGRASKNDTFTRYNPWDGEAGYGGKLYFRFDEKQFRLSRSFKKGMEFQELICEDDGEILDLENGDLQELLGNISEAVYENAVSMTQLRSQADQSLRVELKNYMAGYEGTGDSAVDLNRTMQALKMWRKGFQDQVNRQENAAEEERIRSHASQNYIHNELEQLKERRQEYIQKAESRKLVRRDKSSGGYKIRDYSEAYENRIQEENSKIRRNWFLILLLLACSIGLGIFIGMPKGAAVIAAGVLLDLFLLWSIRKSGEHIKRLTHSLKRRKEDQDEVKWNLQQMQKEIDAKMQELQMQEQAARAREEELSTATQDLIEIQSLDLAMDTIRNLSGRMQKKVSDQLRTGTSRILSEITEGKYTRLYMDENLNISVDAEERRIPLESLSRGTMEQIYFSFRMAVAEMLCPEPIPVILDDVFVMYDEERLSSVLKWLSNSGYQVIICTCHEREQNLMDQLGIWYYRHELS